jgi:hypothetical protein
VDGFIYFYETMKKKKLLKMVFSPSDGQQWMNGSVVSLNAFRSRVARW